MSTRSRFPEAPVHKATFSNQMPQAVWLGSVSKVTAFGDLVTCDRPGCVA